MSSDNLLDAVLDELECGFCVVRHFPKMQNVSDFYQILCRGLSYQKAQEMAHSLDPELKYTKRLSCIYVAHESNIHVGICRS